MIICFVKYCRIHFKSHSNYFFDFFILIPCLKFFLEPYFILLITIFFAKEHPLDDKYFMLYAHIPIFFQKVK